MSSPQKAHSATVLLSIVIVTYQSRAEIGACLESIPQELCGEPVEVIVVDNDSKDGTLQAIREAYPGVNASSSGANLGFGRANNLGISYARGRFVLFLNPDTILNRNALEGCLQRLMSESDIGIISPKLLLETGEMDLACRRSVPTVWDGFMRASGLARIFPRVRLCAGYNLTYLPENETYSVGAVNGAFMMIPRRVLDEIGPFDEKFFMYGEDLDLCHRCSLAGYKVIYDGRYAVIHLKGRSSSKDYRVMSQQVFVGTKQFYLKHFNRDSSRWVRWKYVSLFWLWSTYAMIAGSLTRHKGARPV